MERVSTCSSAITRCVLCSASMALFPAAGPPTHGRRLRQLRAHVAPTAAVDAPPVATTATPAPGFNVHGRPLRAVREDLPLTDEEIASFMELGYVALPGILPEELQQRLRDDVDRMESDRKLSRNGGPKVPFIVEYEELGKLCSFPAVVDKVEQLMRAYGPGNTGSAMHHIHASRHDEGQPSVGWHQDYHCSPAVTDRKQLMVHVFYYFNGLNGTVGDLMCLPGSQKVHIRGIPPTFNKPQDKAQWGDAGGPADLPGHQIFDDLPKGTAIIVHSGLIHSRRAKPGMVDPRYFVDISYCQRGENKWPSYGSNNTHREIFAAALAMGHDRSGRYSHVWYAALFSHTTNLHLPALHITLI